MNISRRSTTSRRNCKCRCPEAGTNLVCSRNGKKARVAGSEGESGKRSLGEVGGVALEVCFADPGGSQNLSGSIYKVKTTLLC